MHRHILMLILLYIQQWQQLKVGECSSKLVTDTVLMCEKAKEDGVAAMAACYQGFDPAAYLQYNYTPPRADFERQDSIVPWKLGCLHRAFTEGETMVQISFRERLKDVEMVHNHIFCPLVHYRGHFIMFYTITASYWFIWNMKYKNKSTLDSWNLLELSKSQVCFFGVIVCAVYI